MESRLSKSLATVSERYSNLTLLRASIAAIPYVGGSIDLLLSAKASKISQKRISEFIGAMKEEMSKVEEAKVDKNFIESEDFYDLLINAFDRSVRTRSTEKKRFFARILAGRITSSNPDTTPAENYLETVAELSETEIIIAREIYNRMVANPKQIEGKKYNWASKRGLNDMYTERIIPQADYEYVLLRLQRVGLLKEQTGTFFGYGGGEYQVTDAFRGLMETLQIPDIA